MPRRYYSSIAVRTTLSSSITDSATSITVAAVTGFPGSFPYTLIIDQDTSDQEVVQVTAASGTTLTVTRGVDGTTAVAHDAGSAVNHGVSARDFNEPNEFLNTGGTIAGPTVVDVNSSSTALRVTQTGSGNAITVEDSTNPDASPFVVDQYGRVIAGDPIARDTDSVTGKMQINTTSVFDGGIGAYAWHNDAASQISTFNKSRGTTPGSHIVVQANDNLGEFRFTGSDGTKFVRGASIVAAVDGTPGTDDMPGRLVFSTTADGASIPTERMRITSAGNVGIGTTNPTTKLDVDGTGNFTGILTAPTAAVTTNTTQVATTAFVNAEIANDAVLDSQFTTKGDIVVASGANTPVRLGVGSINQVLTVDSTTTTGVKWADVASTQPFDICVACSDETTPLTVGTGKVTFRLPRAMSITQVRASVTTAPTGSTIIVDINKNGVSILTTKLSIDATEKRSTTAAVQPVISATVLSDDEEITIDIDQVGSTVAGAGLKVWLIGNHV